MSDQPGFRQPPCHLTGESSVRVAPCKDGCSGAGRPLVQPVGDDLRRAYARLADKGLKDRHVDVLLDHLRDTLKELEVEDEFAEAAVTSAGTLRDILLGR